MPPGVHAKLGASGSHRWRNCAGSNNLSEGMEDITTFAAAEGTVAHRLAEVCLHRGEDYPDHLDEVAGKAFFEEGHEIIIDQEMVDGVTMFVDYVREKAEGKELFIEQEFDLSPLNPPGPMFGTGDAVIWDAPNLHLEVVDLKYGAGTMVEVENNSQVFQYSLGAAVQGITERGQPMPQSFTGTIVQPRIEHDDGYIRSWNFDKEYLIAEKKVHFALAEATLDPDAPLNPGDWCKFCKAKPVCPALKEQTLALAQNAFDVEPTFPDAKGLSLSDLAEVLVKGPAVQDWIKSVGAHALQMLERGEEIPGFKLVEKRTNRRWVDDEKIETYLKGRRLKVSERYKQTLISPAQAEKVLKAKGGAALPARFVEKPKGGSALAPISDKRPERVPGVQQAFGVLTETSESEEE